MTSHTVLWVVVPLLIIGVGLFGFFRFPRGARLINELRPKPSLTDLNAWEIGPILPNAGNMSKNMPLHPAPLDNALFVIDMPTPTSEPHYVTIDHGPLTGKTSIRLKGRAEGGPFLAKDGVSPADLCLYFERQFDDWDATIVPEPGHGSGDLNQGTEYYRWFATPVALAPLVAGDFDITARLTDKWTALRAADEVSDASEDSLNPNEGARYFKQAIDNAGQVGFVLGGGDGWGHGIIATKPSRIIIYSFEIN